MEKLRVALIWPYGFDPDYAIPIALGYLKSNADPERFDLRIFDCAARRIRPDSPKLAAFLKEFSPRVVGVSAWSAGFPEALATVRAVKRANPAVTTIMGGPHITADADRVFQNPEIDFLMRGEAELSFPVFLEELAKGQPEYGRVKGLVWRDGAGGVRRNEMERERNLDRIRWPDYDAIDLDGYLERGYKLFSTEKRNAPLLATRGCPYRCTFCSAPMLWGSKIRRHSIGYLMEQVRYLHTVKGIRWFNIFDDNFTFDVEYAKAFCRAVIDARLEGVSFSTCNGVRMERTDPELWRLMKRAGWHTLIITPESGSPETLSRMRKDLDLDVVRRVAAEIREAGLRTYGFFIVGYPGETRETLKETIDFIESVDFDYVNLSNFQPLPGTPIYEELVALGEIPDGLLPGNYSSGTRVYTPKGLRDVNFPLLILRTYLSRVIRRPSIIPMMMRYNNPKLLFSKLAVNLARILYRGGAGKIAR